MAEEFDFIPLARAAALAHARVFPGESVREMKTLDVLALALSTLVPLYQRESEKEAPRPVRRARGAGERRGGYFPDFGAVPPTADDGEFFSVICFPS